MKIKELLEGYYGGTLTDAEEEQLEMLMLSGHKDIPEEERRLYLGIVNPPVVAKRSKRRGGVLALRISSIAVSVLLVAGLGYYAYVEQQRQKVTEQEILELAMGNVGEALHKTDTTRQQLAVIISSINVDTTKQETSKQKDI